MKRRLRPCDKENQLSKYRRIEINAYRRKVTVVSGEWRPGEVFDAPAQTDEGVSLNDTDSCEPVEPNSPEGQLILVEAVRSLEQRLTPEARAMISAGQDTAAHNSSNRNSFYLNLQSIYQLICQRALRFARKKKMKCVLQTTCKTAFAFVGLILMLVGLMSVAASVMGPSRRASARATAS